MQGPIIQSLSGHAVFLLLAQLATLLLAARACSELGKRMGLPAVVGELAAGIVLGPSLFGHFAPDAFARLFPPDALQFQLLEVVATLGMVLLLFLTGLETDLRLLRSLGRAAFLASLLGMLLPFGAGYALGAWMPEAYLAQPDRRVLFSFFLATAMAISAMPVIARILIDLRLTQRNLGIVILTAGVVDDTAGWLILSMIVGSASSGAVSLSDLGRTLGLTVAFLAAMALLVFPLARGALWLSTRWMRTGDAGLVLILVLALFSAAATEKIGVHAVFGAFVCGAMLRQVPQLDEKLVHRIEDIVHLLLAPVFFGLVGLKVDLWRIESGAMLAIVLSVACAGKLLGCTLGSWLGGMRAAEGLAVGVAMNARGAMELVVATIGLSHGILNPQMFSIIVVVAIATSLMAPLGLRLIMPRLPMTAEESRRILAGAGAQFLDPLKVRVLLATTGGTSGWNSAAVAAGLARRSSNKLAVIAVKHRQSFVQRCLELIVRSHAMRQEVDRQLIKQQLSAAGLEFGPRLLHSIDPAAAIATESRKGFDVLVVGGSSAHPGLGGPTLERLVEGAVCHLIVVRAPVGERPPRRLLVAYDGSLIARAAAEVALALAEALEGELVIALPRQPRSGAFRVPPLDAQTEAPLLEAVLERISPAFKASAIRPQLRQVSQELSPDVLREIMAQDACDLLVVGAENRATVGSLYFGRESELLFEQHEIPLLVVLPNQARGG